MIGTVLAFIFAIGIANAAQIFSDNFDDGNVNGWTTVNNPSPLQGTAWTNTGTFVEAKPGIDSAQGTSTLERIISTSGFQSIIIKYDRQLGSDWESSDMFKVSWSADGVNFNAAEEVIGNSENTLPDDASFVPKTFNIPSSANNNANFKVKFECTTNAQNEFCRIDNIILEGNTILNVPTIAVDSFTAPTQSQNGSLKLRNTGNVALTNIQFSSSGNAQLNFNPASITSLNAGSTSQSIALSITNLNTLKFGLNPTIITATSAEGTSVTTASFNVQKTFCKAGSVGGNLEITDIKIDNQGEGSDDEWKLLDTIEVEVQVDNDGNDDVDDVFVELGLFDSDGNNKVNDLDFDNADEEEFDIGRINDGKDETVTFKFKIPTDMDDGSYRLAVKTYSDDVGEEVECVDESTDLSDDIFENIDIDRETDEGKFIAFDNLILTPSQATCEESVSFTFDVVNIGDEDQDQVKVDLISSQLGISESFEIRNDLDQGDEEGVTFDFIIPNNAQDGIYQLRLSSEYDYRSGSYRESSEEDKLVPITILGCQVGSPGSSGGTPTPSNTRIASISAVLDSDAMAGEELVVRSTITNLGTETKSFIVDAKDFSSWAELDSISERILNLAGGASRDITFRFNVDADAEGEESFIIEVSSGADFEAREVAVNIEGEGSGSGGITGAAIGFGDNAYIWIIGIVNVILIILIIIVAVRISRR